MEEDPVFLYLKEDAKNIPNIQQIYVKIWHIDLKEVYDIWYIIDQESFDKELAVCIFHVGLSNHFPSLLFDIMIFGTVQESVYIKDFRKDFQCIWSKE